MKLTPNKQILEHTFETEKLVAAESNFHHLYFVFATSQGWYHWSWDDDSSLGFSTVGWGNVAYSLAVAQDLSVGYAIIGEVSGSQQLKSSPLTPTVVATTIGTITGVTAGSVIYSLATNPKTGELWAAARRTSDGRVEFYILNTSTAVATLQGVTNFAIASGTNFGFDFMPDTGAIFLAHGTGAAIVIVECIFNYETLQYHGVRYIDSLPLSTNATNFFITPRKTMIVPAVIGGAHEINLKGAVIKGSNVNGTAQISGFCIPPVRVGLYPGVPIFRTYEKNPYGEVVSVTDRLQDGTIVSLPSDFALLDTSEIDDSSELTGHYSQVSRPLSNTVLAAATSTTYTDALTLSNEQYRIRKLVISNQLNKDVWISFDGSTDHLYIPQSNNAPVIIDFETNSLEITAYNNWNVAPRNRVRVRNATVGAATGQLTITAFI